MANRHYGKIGDVWKHLILAELLQSEAPAEYWESHAGAADYALTHSVARDYGAYYFFRNAQRSERLQRTPYFRILRSLACGTDELRNYPGSTLLAMLALKETASQCFFCDLDQSSLSTIRQRAAQLGIGARVETEHADGVKTLGRKISELPAADAARIFVHLDPYLPLATDDNGRSSADLFWELAAKGARAMLWYGFGSEDELAVLMKGLRAAVAAHGLRAADHRIWRGEIVLAAMHDPDFDINPGVMGCGVLCSNLSAKAVAACKELGVELARLYAHAKFPDGSTGALEFRQHTF
jgi:23S rRNA (adenine2030-N6)-methyltransferase